MKPISFDDVRNEVFWTHPEGGVWRIVTFCAEPTVTFERVDEDRPKRGGAINSPLVRDFRRLVPEDTGA